MKVINKYNCKNLEDHKIMVQLKKQKLHKTTNNNNNSK